MNTKVLFFILTLGEVLIASERKTVRHNTPCRKTEETLATYLDFLGHIDLDNAPFSFLSDISNRIQKLLNCNDTHTLNNKQKETFDKICSKIDQSSKKFALNNTQAVKAFEPTDAN